MDQREIFPAPLPFLSLCARHCARSPRANQQESRPSGAHLPWACSLYGGADIRLFQNVERQK